MKLKLGTRSITPFISGSTKSFKSQVWRNRQTGSRQRDGRGNEWPNLRGGWGSAYKDENLDLLSWGLNRLRWVTVPMQCLEFWPMLRADWALYSTKLALFLLLWHSYLRNSRVKWTLLPSHLTYFCSAQGSCIEAWSLENRGQPLAWKTNPILAKSTKTKVWIFLLWNNLNSRHFRTAQPRKFCWQWSSSSFACHLHCA